MKKPTVHSTLVMLFAAGGIAFAGAASAAGPRHSSDGYGSSTYRDELAV